METVERAFLLVDAHTEGRESVRVALQRWIESRFAQLDMADMSEQQLDALIAQVAAQITTAQVVTARLTWAYLDQLGEEVVGGAPVVDADRVRQSVEKIIATPTVGDAATPQALTSLGDRLLERSVTDGARQHAAARATPVTGFRRVIHPERSKGGACGLCVAAATQVYHSRDLKPIHARCKCTVAEITRSHDPGRAMNDVDLDAITALSNGNTARDLKRTRFTGDPRKGEDLTPTLAPARRKGFESAKTTDVKSRGSSESETPADKQRRIDAALTDRNIATQLRILRAMAPPMTAWREQQIARYEAEAARRAKASRAA